MIRALALLVVVAVLLPACQSGGMPWQKQQPPAVSPVDTPSTMGAHSAPVVPQGLARSSESRFKDVPMPIGLNEIPERSFVFENDTLQVGRMAYSSRAKVNDLVQFFLDECPKAQWKQINVLEAEAKTIELTKPGKKLIISVQNMGPMKGRLVLITLTPDSGAMSSL